MDRAASGRVQIVSARSLTNDLFTFLYNDQPVPEMDFFDIFFEDIPLISKQIGFLMWRGFEHSIDETLL
jgi:hypothetical protein